MTVKFTEKFTQQAIKGRLTRLENRLEKINFLTWDKKKKEMNIRIVVIDKN